MTLGTIGHQERAGAEFETGGSVRCRCKSKKAMNVIRDGRSEVAGVAVSKYFVCCPTCVGVVLVQLFCAEAEAESTGCCVAGLTFRPTWIMPHLGAEVTAIVDDE